MTFKIHIFYIDKIYNMDRFRKNLYTAENLRVVGAELDTIDSSLEKKIIGNTEYTNFLNSLLTDTMDHFETIIRSLDGGKKSGQSYIDNRLN
jgi:hypothetical protein